MSSESLNPFHSRRRLGLIGICAALAAGVALHCPLPSKAAADTHEAQLTAKAGSADAHFGTGVSISGDTAVAGAPDEGDTEEDGGGMGAAYVFTRGDGKWTERATLVAPVRTDGDKFGFSVAIDRDTIVVGAPNADERVPRPGAAYVFVRRGATWVHQATLTPPARNADDAFGFRVAISGDTALIGADGGNVRPSPAGAAYVFTRTGEVWTEQAQLTASDGPAASGFGFAVAVSDDTAVVSAIADVGAVGLAQGAVYVFTRTGAAWAEQAKLVASDGSPGDAFGASVGIFRDTVVVGAQQDEVGLNPLQGSAYVFVRSGKSWAQQAKLTAPASDGGARELFGRSVATNGDVVAVGAHFDEPGGGAVYVFNRSANTWGKPTRLTATGASLHGLTIGLSGNSLIAGANFTKVGENAGQGAAYVYRLRPAGAAS